MHTLEHLSNFRLVCGILACDQRFLFKDVLAHVIEPSVFIKFVRLVARKSTHQLLLLGNFLLRENLLNFSGLGWLFLRAIANVMAKDPFSWLMLLAQQDRQEALPIGFVLWWQFRLSCFS